MKIVGYCPECDKPIYYDSQTGITQQSCDCETDEDMKTLEDKEADRGDQLYHEGRDR